MVFNTTTALGAMTGARYIESLKDGREVWLDGEKVQDVATYPAFTGMVHELARVYDLQHTETYRDQMLFFDHVLVPWRRVFTL
jgi:4-hydroxyphenylacetate 3-monooxygenase